MLEFLKAFMKNLLELILLFVLILGPAEGITNFLRDSALPLFWGGLVLDIEFVSFLRHFDD